MKESILTIVNEAQALREIKGHRREAQDLLAEAAALEWQRQVADLRVKLAQFTDEADPRNVQQAHRGMQRLAPALIRRKEFLRPAHEINWRAFKAALTAFAEQNLPDSKPDSFIVHPDHEAKRGMHVEGERDGLILPRTVSMLFDRYGLTGDPMSLTELSRKYGYAGSERARRIVARGRRKLQLTDEIINPIYRPKPQHK